MAAAMKCDICGEIFINTGHKTNHIWFGWKTGDTVLPQESIDICPVCLEDVKDTIHKRKWIKRGDKI